MKYRKGTTRFVLLIGNLAFKFPIFWNWRKFLKGLLANMSENYQYKVKFRSHDLRYRLCPTYFSIAGFLNVMPRTTEFDISKHLDANERRQVGWYGVFTQDVKVQNFGKYDGQWVLHDYDDTHYNCSECEIYLRNKIKQQRRDENNNALRRSL